MRFEFYSDKIANLPKLSVDGTVDDAIHFSHWHGNQTPPEVKADTSTEIALNLVASPEREKLTRGIELVTNNHFDTDGVLSVWTVLNAERALSLREELIAAAEAGDFSELSSVDGVRASIVIQASDSPIDKSGSPLAEHLTGTAVSDEARAYELVLPHVEQVLTHNSDYEFLWREPWSRIERALESFARGASEIVEDTDARFSLITLAPEVFGTIGFEPALHAAPFTAISHHARGELFVIVTPLAGGLSYRIDYPYYSWAETVVRPAIPRRDFSALMNELNELEQNPSAAWKLDTSELASAAKFIDQSGFLGASKLEPQVVAARLRNFLLGSIAATAH